MPTMLILILCFLVWFLGLFRAHHRVTQRGYPAWLALAALPGPWVVPTIYWLTRQPAGTPALGAGCLLAWMSGTMVSVFLLTAFCAMPCFVLLFEGMSLQLPWATRLMIALVGTPAGVLFCAVLAIAGPVTITHLGLGLVRSPLAWLSRPDITSREYRACLLELIQALFPATVCAGGLVAALVCLVFLAALMPFYQLIG
jgi:hypothetical protein